MAYLENTSPKDRAKSVVGVIAIHGAIGYALIIGLQFSGVIKDDTSLGSIFVPDIPIEPPPPPPPEQAVEQPQAPQASEVFVPQPPIKLDIRPPLIPTTLVMPPPSDPVIPRVFPGSTPLPPGNLTPLADPIGAKPRNDAGGWITDSDYRSSWISRGFEGPATFKVTVGANGRVQDCVVTRTTGHSALDDATCNLVTRRARFNPARDAQGDKVSGSFTGSVSWRIPE